MPLSPEVETLLRRVRKALKKDCNLMKGVVEFTQTIIILLYYPQLFYNTGIHIHIKDTYIVGKDHALCKS